MSDEQIVAHFQNERVPRADVVEYAQAKGILPVVSPPTILDAATESAKHAASMKPFDIVNAETGEELTIPGSDPGHVAMLQMLAINELLEEVRPDDPEDMDLVERVKRLLAAPPAAPPQPVQAAPGLVECELVVPFPVFADMGGLFMRHNGDVRYNGSACSRRCAGAKWEFSYREGTFVGTVTRGWDEVQTAQEDMMTVNSRIASADLAARKAKGLFQNKTRQLAAIAPPAAPKTRVVSHQQVGKGKRAKMEPVVIEVEERRAAKPSQVERLAEEVRAARKAMRDTAATLKQYTDRRAECKRLIEGTVPTDFSFTLADVASGRVRIADRW